MQSFENAGQVFIKNKRETVNFQAGFKCLFNADKSKRYILHITGATLYRVYLNNRFIFYGPARAAHGYIRFDEIELSVTDGENVLCVEVAGYNCPSFYTMNIKSFLQAEIFEDERSIAFTGRDFAAISLDKIRERAVYRYSYQRAFTEVYYLDNHDKFTNWKTEDFESEPINRYVYEEKIIPRMFANPEFRVEECRNVIKRGHFKSKNDLNNYEKRHITGLSYEIKGFPRYMIKNDVMSEIHGKYFADNLSCMNTNRYTMYDYGKINTGFITADITAFEDSEIYLIFSEKIKNGQPDSGIYDCDTVNVVKYELKTSEKSYNLQSFEAYSFKYLTILVRRGRIEVNHVGLCEYSYPVTENTQFDTEDNALKLIFDAAKETFRQNTIDCFMDCPGRERAGWLCDSFFTAQAEQIFAGGGVVEEQFLKAFISAKDIPGIDCRALPMCYPGENNGVIEQWVMWYILELEMYLKRKKDNREYFKEFCYRYIEYLSKFSCENGLITKMNGWNFIEWSDANEFVEESDISYPTNMLYARTLEAVSNIYDDKELAAKAKQIKKVIVEKGFDGKFFCDGAVYKNNQYQNLPNISEACQYYAAFTGTADESNLKFNDFFYNLYNVLGYARKLDGKMPEVAFANLFIGFTVRFMYLLNAGKCDKLLNEIIGFYEPMAKKTGTLWEQDTSIASLNHGISSVAAVLIIKALTGISEINEADKVIKVKNVDHDRKYKISVGLTDGMLYAENSGSGRKLRVDGDYVIECEEYRR